MGSGATKTPNYFTERKGSFYSGIVIGEWVKKLKRNRNDGEERSRRKEEEVEVSVRWEMKEERYVHHYYMKIQSAA